ncbi:acyl-CoA dehydrogenase family protein [Jatrophihabitans cynanchi]|uniref:Acyl-CoA dehydrogenase family protein n=1 Tax=Jatrophihabitans cynanchi TaxID=2944128 RepID=A0ABY7JVE7_9ACTN|nr:acyl-CoA dehydrogenase [Jatrophihabitans sp. SB3-54]WAX56298.1 acyl-CoA dehydrogenase family protein [Jatrophihabitans sp. SB3-54]
MRFELDADAAALRDAVAAVLTKEVTGSVIRAGWPDGDGAVVSAAWRKLADVGVLGTLAPEAAGGLGLDLNSALPALERFGHSGLPMPVVETIAVAAPLLADARSDRLGDVLSGTAVLTAALGDSGLVPFGAGADLLVLRHGGQLRLYERGELALEPVDAVDGSRALARRTGPAAGGTVLTDDPDEVELAWQRGVIGTAAVLVGLADRMLAMTVEYVQQRQQYGVPVGSFQAIKHALASALVAVEFARPAVLAAGWALAAGVPDADAQVGAAKVLASDAARLLARTSIQCHGAMGYTTEHDLQLFAKRAWALAPDWGSPGWHRARLASALGIGE